jgi:hypothetical protein
MFLSPETIPFVILRVGSTITQVDLDLTVRRQAFVELVQLVERVGELGVVVRNRPVPALTLVLGSADGFSCLRRTIFERRRRTTMFSKRKDRAPSVAGLVKRLDISFGICVPRRVFQEIVDSVVVGPVMRPRHDRRCHEVAIP